MEMVRVQVWNRAAASLKVFWDFAESWKCSAFQISVSQPFFFKDTVHNNIPHAFSGVCCITGYSLKI